MNRSGFDASAAELRLTRQREEECRVILDAVPTSIWYLDRDGRIQRVNAAAAKIMGRSLEELIGKSLFDLFPHDQAVKALTDNREIIASGRPKLGIVEEFTTPIGRRWLRTDKMAHFGPHGTPVGIIAVSQDITERKLAEERLRERDEQLRLTFQYAPMGIVTYDLSGRFLSANPAASAVTGYNEAELLRMTLKDITHPDDWEESADCLQRAAQGLINSYTIRKRYLRKDGTIIHIIGYNAVAHDQEGRPAMIIGQIEDLSERLKAEEEARLHRERLAHVTRLHTLGEMAAGIAHEINQPLTAIANYTQACRRRLTAGTASPAKLLDLLVKIDGQAQRAGEIIRRIRALGRKRESEYQLTDVNAIVQEGVNLARVDTRALDCRIELALARQLPAVAVDPIQIQQVILNLIRNSLDAMETVPAGERRITVTTACSSSDSVEVAIADRGVGLPDAAAEQLFDPFFTTKHSGMGVGLSISRSIITSHGGWLWFTRNADCGTTFRFTLPIAKGGNHAQA